jgi:uncharacterized repeat protein (TIGR03803 family)
MGEIIMSSRGCIIAIFCAVGSIASAAQNLNTLYSFNGNAEGAAPLGALTQATDGNLYGTTGGGVSENFGYGTIFKTTPSGAVTTLYSFCSMSGCPDGTSAAAPLVQAADGDFYGTTEKGGTHDSGTVYKVTASGALTTLYNFCSISGCTDGYIPGPGGLLQSSDRNFYGTTEFGGTHGSGTVYKISSAGILTTVYNFCSQSNCADGYLPIAGLIQASDGNFYGDTYYGGTNDEGTVFRISLAGALTTIYSFCSQSNCTDGSEPVAGLVQAIDGNFYGTTSGFGGGSTNYGTVYKITSDGKLKTLHVFDRKDGSTPYAAMIQAGDRNLYGTTDNGGDFGDGILFEITPNGTMTTLYSFCSQSDCGDGKTPFASLVQDTNGAFYGTTELGGANDSCFNGCGTIFLLNTGLGPFVESRPSSGAVGAPVVLLGTSLTGATTVTFNGTAATFRVASGSEIKTSVPSGATSGLVEVTTPSGILKSSAPFRVIK